MFALKKLALATVLALSAFGAQAVVPMPTPCTGEVALGAINSSIPGAGCINTAIQDEPNRWGNHGEFVRHVSNVTLALLKNKTIGARERSLIMKAAARFDPGNTLNIKLLTINDFHGTLEPPAGGSGRIGSINAGRTQYLATHIAMSLNGAQIKDLLEQQFPGCTNSQPFNRILQASNSFEYTWNATGVACNKVDPNSIRISGVSISPARSYRIRVNSFLAEGGDSFQVFKDGTDRLAGAQDLDALDTYLSAHSPTTPGPQNRITRKNRPVRRRHLRSNLDET